MDDFKLQFCESDLQRWQSLSCKVMVKREAKEEQTFFKTPEN